MLTLKEADAHIKLVDMMDRKATGYHGLAAQPYLQVFEPRCPGCRTKLWLSDFDTRLVRVLECPSCKWTCQEHPIWI